MAAPPPGAAELPPAERPPAAAAGEPDEPPLPERPPPPEQQQQHGGASSSSEGPAPATGQGSPGGGPAGQPEGDAAASSPPESGESERTESTEDLQEVESDRPKLSRWSPSRFLADRACGCVFVGLVICSAITGLGLGLLPLNVETDFNSFLMTDVESSIRLHAFNGALDSRSGYSRRLQDQGLASRVVYGTKDLYLFYQLAGEGLQLDGGIYHSKAINAIARFEQSLRSLPDWQALCDRADNDTRALCQDGVSFVRYMMPSPVYQPGTVVPTSLVLDGNGFDPVSPKTALLLANYQGMASLLLPESYNFSLASDAEPYGELLRSAFRFRVPCCTAADSIWTRQRFSLGLTMDWTRFIRETLLPLLKEQGDTEKQSASPTVIKVWWDGTDIAGEEVKEALKGDIYLVAISIVFILLYLVCHTRSLLLSFVGPIIALFAVPLTFVFCAVIFGTSTLNFTNFLALFLIVGFGADVMLVYTDFWEESALHRQDHGERLAWTFERAIKSSLTTSGTTAVSFYSNLTSVIRALRQFGFFMGTCVILAWFLITVIFVPLMVIDSRIKERCQPAFCRRVDAFCTSVGDSESTKSRLWGGLASCLRRLRRTTFLLGLVTCVVALVVSVPKVKTGEEVPNIFPADHNENAGKQVRDQFTAASDAFGTKFVNPAKTVTICDVVSLASSSTSNCPMFWCEAKPSAAGEGAPSWSGNGTCACWRRYDPLTCGGSSAATVTMRFVGPTSLNPNQAADIAAYIAQTGKEVTVSKGVAASSFTGQRSIPPTLMQDWESGDVSLQNTLQVVVPAVRPTNSTTAPCGWEDVCFCGGPLVCKLSGTTWQSMPTLTLRPWGRRLLIDEQYARVPAGRRTKVRAIFGLQVDMTVNLLEEVTPQQSWGFLDTFDMRQPWTQRNILSFCTNVPDELRVVNMWCWMQDFRSFLRSETGRFPARAVEFGEMANRFIDSGGGSTPGTRYLWVVGGEVKAMYVSMDADINKGSDSATALSYKVLWDKYVADYNAQAFKAAQGAFQVSELWTQAEATGQLIISTVETLVILWGVCFVVMLVFTSSPALAIYVTVATMGAVCCLLFYIVIINQWELGLIEVIAIIYFVGYALDYSLHIAYKYSSAEALDQEVYIDVGDVFSSIRLQRVTFALKQIGGAVIGSAATTIGASVFLVLCQLTVFKKLGGMCLAVTIISLIISLGPLPAGLLWFGPVDPGWPAWCCCCCKRRRESGGTFRTLTHRHVKAAHRARE